ncbi:unnamed protein product [Cochlearia groenlandica]
MTSYPPRRFEEGLSLIQVKSMGHYCYLSRIQAPKTFIGPDVWEAMKESCPRVFLKLNDMEKYTWCAQTVHSFLTNQLEVNNKHEFWSILDDLPIREAFSCLVQSMRQRSFVGETYTIHGCVLALLIWVYEFVPGIGELQGHKREGIDGHVFCSGKEDASLDKFLEDIIEDRFNPKCWPIVEKKKEHKERKRDVVDETKGNASKKSNEDEQLEKGEAKGQASKKKRKSERLSEAEIKYSKEKKSKE